MLSDLPKWLERLYVLDRWRREVRYWLLNMFVRRKNRVVLKALRRREWYDTDTRMFEAVFQLLVDYVEGELAWMELCGTGKQRWWQRWVTPKNARELGLKHLDWEIGLGDESHPQAVAARQIKALYLWYRDVRPTRTDPWDFKHKGPTGTSTPCEWDKDGKPTMYKFEFPDDPEYTRLSAAAHDMERSYVAEDTAKMIEAVTLRGTMWT